MKRLVLIAAVLSITSGAFYAWRQNAPDILSRTLQGNIGTTIIRLPASVAIARGPIVPPVDDFLTRITKKSFGTFITPETSPVANDRFSGFHTGVDVEYDDVAEDIAIYAIADGTVIASTFGKGYGGVVVVRHETEQILALYGHLDPATLPARGTKLRQGQFIGVLGADHSEETDGVRKHLHFSIQPDRGGEIDIRGYVKTEEELTQWIDPLALYR